MRDGIQPGFPPPLSRPACVPAQNVLWFWFDQATRRQMHGTVADAARKQATLAECGLGHDGLEIFLMPSRIEHPRHWPSGFTRDFTALAHRTVHIAETEDDFLLRPGTADNLRRLHLFLTVHGVTRIILHAHHLEHERPAIRRLLLDVLPGIEVCVENTGFSNRTGHQPEFMEQLLRDMPECTVCLDIAHVEDFDTLSVAQFTANPVIAPRIRELHFSLSTNTMRQAGRDVYAERGLPGYDPFHALYAVLRARPGDATMDAVGRHHVVLEGVVPQEDRTLRFLRDEMRMVAERQGVTA